MKRSLIWLVCPLLFALIAMFVLISGCSSKSTGVDEEDVMELLSETSVIDIMFQGYSQLREYHYALGDESYDTSFENFSISISNDVYGRSIEWAGNMFSVQFDSIADTLGETTTYSLVINGIMSSNGREIETLSALYLAQFSWGVGDGIEGRELYLHDIPLTDNGSDIVYSCDGYMVANFVDSIKYYQYYNSLMPLEDSLDYLSTDWQNMEYPPEITVTFRRE